ncbi:MAG TPA: hypothetical protein VMZ27_09620, partial [Candidatus Saccharimonadales bacterium]|nr:hypothetical protein [Candidatus Saccharimonadales bacterium]
MRALLHGPRILALTWLSLIHPAFGQDSVTTQAGQPLISGSLNGLGTNALVSDPAGIASDLK